MFNATVNVDELVDVLAAMGDRAKDLSPIMAVIAEDLVSAVSDRIESEGNGQWPPHAPSTIAKRRGGGRGAKLLQDTGDLVSSFEPDHGPDFAEAATGVSYVVYHLEGGDIIPKRNPVELEDEIFDSAVDTILEYVVDG